MSLVGLTDEQYAHLHEAWRLFDTDEDGLVTPQDLQRLLRSLIDAHAHQVGMQQVCASQHCGAWVCACVCGGV